MKRFGHCAAACLLACTAVAQSMTGPVVVSSNHRFLQYSDGMPFFWLGDTAWNLLSKLDRAATERYLDDRQKKGFNVLQVVVDHVGDLAEGHPEKWEHLDWVITAAAQRGMILALLPAWGSVVKNGRLNEQNASAYATFLARRYRDRPNIVWILGGDIPGDVHGEVWKLMGRTLKKEDPAHLVSFHPFGRTQSSEWFHNEPWLDFNMFQSGHQRYDQDTKSPHRYGEDNWRYAASDYARRPVRPFVDGEPSYENIPQGLHDTSQPYWTDADCRRYAYWSVFAGAFGHTYGDNAVMQFHRPGDGQGAYGPRNTWDQALDDPGAGQMQFLKRLILSRPFFDRVPDQSALAGENGTRYDYVAVTRGKDYLFAYTYTGRPFEIRMGILTGARVKATWYNPRDGSSQAAGDFSNRGPRRFQPPGTPAPGNDWVLMLDGASK